uniref:Uncharacterized protein n=1 Tax=Oncorhynchus tshawytscha TaxID=74940 RepID=A0AAZ3QCE8_ONCTS
PLGYLLLICTGTPCIKPCYHYSLCIYYYLFYFIISILFLSVLLGRSKSAFHCWSTPVVNKACDDVLSQKTLNIQDVGMMPMGAMTAAATPAALAVEEDAAPVKKEKTHFTVKLTELKAAEKVKLIKEVKNSIQGLNLVQ